MQYGLAMTVRGHNLAFVKIKPTIKKILRSDKGVGMVSWCWLTVSIEIEL